MSNIIYMRDLDGTGSMHPCLKGDPGAVAYCPLVDDRKVAANVLYSYWQGRRFSDPLTELEIEEIKRAFYLLRRP